jgi:prepilin peptidase CpaA
VTPLNFPYFLLTGLIVLACAVSLSDFRSRRIPNAFLAAALLYALACYGVAAVGGGAMFALRAVGFGVLGMLLGLLMLYPAHATRQVGAGDVKLMMVFGFYLGPIGGVLALLTGALIGGAWALVISWRSGGLRAVLYNLRNMARAAYASGFKELSWDLRSVGAVTMPYGVALSAGAVIVAVWQLAIRLGQG